METKLVLAPIKELVTVESSYSTDANPLGVLHDAAVAIEGEQIAWVGKAEDLPSEFDHAERLDASDVVIMPGLIDPHTHLVFTGDRSGEFEQKVAGVPYMEIARQGGGILATVRSVRSATLEQLVTEGLKRLKAALALGITTVEIKSGYGLTTEDELKMLEAIHILEQTQPVEVVPTFLGAHEFPPEFRDSQPKRDAYVKLVCDEMIPAVSEQGIAKFIDVFCEEEVFNLDQTRAVLETGIEYGLVPKLHADEFSAIGGTELAVELGAASVDHLHVITDRGIEALAGSNTVGVLLPGTSFFLGKTEHAPARKMLEAGVRLAIATDFNPGSSMTQNLPLAGTIACVQMRMPPDAVLKALTINAAAALRLDDRIGSIEVGKQADLIAIDAPNWRYLFYYYAMPLTEFVIKRGRLVWERAE